MHYFTESKVLSICLRTSVSKYSIECSYDVCFVVFGRRKYSVTYLFFGLSNVFILTLANLFILRLIRFQHTKMDKILEVFLFSMYNLQTRKMQVSGTHGPLCHGEGPHLQYSRDCTKIEFCEFLLI